MTLHSTAPLQPLDFPIVSEIFLVITRSVFHSITLFETENERQKTKPVPIPLPRVSRNFPDVYKLDNYKMCNFWHFKKNSRSCPIIEKKLFLVLTSGKFLEGLGSGIGTGLVFCLSFSISNNVYRGTIFCPVHLICCLSQWCEHRLNSL